jgi:hypothetical protein
MADDFADPAAMSPNWDATPPTHIVPRVANLRGSPNVRIMDGEWDIERVGADSLKSAGQSGSNYASN